MYINASYDAWRAQLSQEHDGQYLPVTFLLHTFTDTQWKLRTREQQDNVVYYSVTKWNYYLQGSDIIIHNVHKPLQNFLNGKTANNKVNRWSLELATYNINFEWISGAHNMAADCLLWLVNVKDTPAMAAVSINMLVTSTPDGPATHTCNKTCHTGDATAADTTPTSTNDKVNTPPTLMADWKDTL